MFHSRMGEMRKRCRKLDSSSAYLPVSMSALLILLTAHTRVSLRVTRGRAGGAAASLARTSIAEHNLNALVHNVCTTGGRKASSNDDSRGVGRKRIAAASGRPRGCAGLQDIGLLVPHRSDLEFSLGFAPHHLLHQNGHPLRPTKLSTAPLARASLGAGECRKENLDAALPGLLDEEVRVRCKRVETCTISSILIEDQPWRSGQPLTHS